MRLGGTMRNMPDLLELPSEHVAHEAQRAQRGLSRLSAADREHIQLRVDGGEDEAVLVPRAAFDLFLEILGQMANGNAVTIVPVHAELTTQQAADLLNVSRPYLVRLLEDGSVPYRKVGTHRRVKFADLVVYREQQAQRARAAMQALARESQELGLDF
jgi:excisionase family DNA binding protein